MKTIYCLVIIIGFGLAGLSSAKAGDEQIGRHALMTPAEIEMQAKSKKRLYPGGRDEESLKVQAQLPQVTRKMSPVTENTPEDSAEPAEEY